MNKLVLITLVSVFLIGLISCTTQSSEPVVAKEAVPVDLASPVLPLMNKEGSKGNTNAPKKAAKKDKKGKDKAKVAAKNGKGNRKPASKPAKHE